jgi:hypothetical protein
MLSPDPIVQEPYNAQNLNRYSYVLNNPLSYTDPSGLSFVKKYWRAIVAIAVSVFLPGAGGLLATMGVSNTLAQFAIAGFVSGGVASGSLKGALTGAFTSMAMFGLSQVSGLGSTAGADQVELATPSALEPSPELLTSIGDPTQAGLMRVGLNPQGVPVSLQRITSAGINNSDTIATNGMINDLNAAVRNGTTHISKITGSVPSSYVLNFNPTKGFFPDLLEASRDIFATYTGRGGSGLAKRFASDLAEAKGRGVSGLTLVGHSQGGAITTSAIRSLGGSGGLSGTVSALHLSGAPIQSLYANHLSKRSFGVSAVSRAQLGDPVYGLAGMNFLHNPIRLPMSILSFPRVFSNDWSVSPHTIQCAGARGGVCR